MTGFAAVAARDTKTTTGLVPMAGFETSMANSRRIVAVVDDDQSMLNSIEYLLDAHGYAAELFRSAETYVNRQAQGDISCMVLDIHLGGMSGLDLQRHLSQHHHRFPIIFITAVADEASIQATTEAGCALLRKPFSSGRLIDAIRHAIENNE